MTEIAALNPVSQADKPLDMNGDSYYRSNQTSCLDTLVLDGSRIMRPIATPRAVDPKVPASVVDLMKGSDIYYANDGEAPPVAFEQHAGLRQMPNGDIHVAGKENLVRAVADALKRAKGPGIVKMSFASKDLIPAANKLIKDAVVAKVATQDEVQRIAFELLIVEAPPAPKKRPAKPVPQSKPVKKPKPPKAKPVQPEPVFEVGIPLSMAEMFVSTEDEDETELELFEYVDEPDEDEGD